MNPEWLTAFAALLSALSWPLAVVAVVFLLRKDLSHLLNRVEGLDFAGSKVQFNRQIKEGLTNAEEKFAESSEGIRAPVNSVTIDQTMIELIERNPRQAIKLTWDNLVASIVKLADKIDLWVDLRSMRKTADQLQGIGAISQELAETIKSLHSTFKSALRVDDFDVDRESVERYVHLALDTKKAIDAKIAS